MIFQSTRPMRGATGSAPETAGTSGYFNPRAPCGARHHLPGQGRAVVIISIHAPHAGRDEPVHGTRGENTSNFNPRAPCGARRQSCWGFLRALWDFNPRAPCGARLIAWSILSPPVNFNPRAPCGARPQGPGCIRHFHDFNPRAPCGARRGGLRRLQG